ncbi:hypothetical protein [Corynebacterium doosanense]|uniref:Uncharacterized protein n=1 Tax=Corynebacterium doosanense CAU 212 = DSM 45436 TaxID=558173 RepID=A0A097IJN3_9CORY|nr:hypothetical protein [Corynebacterium doosanense]AIT62313.1 hypothetical protein CDOO_10305 [Corynebacterium doosanense CAU 212 = DSM 45436]
MTRFLTTAALAFAVCFLLFLLLSGVADLRMLTAMTVLAPLGVALTTSMRRSFRGLLDDAHLASATLTTSSVFAMTAALFQSSGRFNLAAALLALTAGALAGAVLHRSLLVERPAGMVPAAVLGGVLGGATLIAVGGQTIVGFAAALTLLAAASVTVSAARGEEPVEPAPERELVSAR